MNSPNLAKPDEPQNDRQLFAPPPSSDRPAVGYQSNDALAVNTRGGAGSIPRYDANAGNAQGNPFGRSPLTARQRGH
jgi:hypothetical protein